MSVLDRMTNAEIAHHMAATSPAPRARVAIEGYWPGGAGAQLERLRARIRDLEAEAERLRAAARRELAARVELEETVSLLRHALATKDLDDAR